MLVMYRTFRINTLGSYFLVGSALPSQLPNSHSASVRAVRLLLEGGYYYGKYGTYYMPTTYAVILA